MKKVLLTLFFFLSIVYAEEEIEVALSTQKLLYPVYLSLINKDKSDIEEEYLEKIRDVLLFDLENSGYIALMSREKSKDILLSNPDFKIAFDPEFWKSQKVSIVIKLTSAQKKLNVFLYDPTKLGYSYFSTIYLSSDLNVDRRKIHKISDDILSEYFGKKGIAQSSILFTIRRDNPDKNAIPWLSEVWMCDYDGGNRRQLTFENNYCISPVCLSGKDKELPSFLYVSYKKGIPKIYINSEEKKGQIVSLRGNQLLPSISQKMDQIAFISDAAGRPDLFVQKFDRDRNEVGKPVQLFSMPKASQATSTFSPDGHKLAFVSDKDGTPRIYIIKIPDNEKNHVRPYAHLVTKKNRYNVTPSWSNDGTKIAYSAKTDGIRQIWVYNFIADEEIQLTFGKENKENPCWAEDNLHIVYNTEDRTVSELCIINLNNPKPVKISSGFGQKRFPAWGW